MIAKLQKSDNLKAKYDIVADQYVLAGEAMR